MLNDFSVGKQSGTATTAATADAKSEPLTDGTKAAKETAPQPSAEDAFSEEEFAKQLQAGMADLLGELEKSVSANTK